MLEAVNRCPFKPVFDPRNVRDLVRQKKARAAVPTPTGGIPLTDPLDQTTSHPRLSGVHLRVLSAFLQKKKSQNKPNATLVCNAAAAKQTQSNPIYWLSRALFGFAASSHRSLATLGAECGI
jgi:hypothetical protein